MTDAEAPATERPADDVRVEWRLFAELAETAGTDRITVDLDGSATLAGALGALVAAEPSLEGAVRGPEGGPAERLTVLRNGERVADPGCPVAGGDELALMPPVAGG